MVIYTAQCKDEREAIEVQQRLMSVCPTLVFSRILKKPRDLDAFNADILTAADEQHRVGALVYDQDPRKLDGLLKGMSSWVVAVILAVSVAAWIASRFLFARAHPLLGGVAVVWALVLVCLGVYGLANLLKYKNASESSRRFWRVERWLRKGNPVVIAGSDSPPDDHVLPRNVRYFEEAA